MYEQQAIREAAEELVEAGALGEPVVITGGYDMEIGDYLDTMEEEGRQEVYAEWGWAYGNDEAVPAMVISKIDEQGYIDTSEALARVVSFENYNKLGRELG